MPSGVHEREVMPVPLYNEASGSPYVGATEKAVWQGPCPDDEKTPTVRFALPAASSPSLEMSRDMIRPPSRMLVAAIFGSLGFVMCLAIGPWLVRDVSKMETAPCEPATKWLPSE